MIKEWSIESMWMVADFVMVMMMLMVVISGRGLSDVDGGGDHDGQCSYIF